MTGMIIENIGWDGCMFPKNSMADPPVGGPLRCYEDSIVGLFKLYAYDCDYIETEISHTMPCGYSIYPNPANTTLFIQGKGIQKIVLSDLSGKDQITQLCSGSKIELDVSGLARGVYIVKVVTEEGVVSEKVILQ